MHNDKLILKPEKVDSSQEVNDDAPVERKKTMEELQKENVRLLTQKAKFSIKKGRDKEREEEKLKNIKEIENGNKRKEVSEKETIQADASEEVEDSPKKPKSIFSKLKDRYRLQKLKKEGFKSPEKALEFFEYVCMKMGKENHYRFNNKYILNWIKETFNLTDDPISFYEKLSQVTGESVIPTTSDIEESWGAGRIMKEPGFLEKMDLCKSVGDFLGQSFSETDVFVFCENSEIHSKLTKENLERIKNLMDLLDKPLSTLKNKNLELLLSYAEDNDFYKFLVEFLNSPHKNKVDVISLRNIGDTETARNLLAGADVKLNLKNIIDDLDRKDDEERNSTILEIESLGLKELTQDKDFKEFAENFSFLIEKSFRLDEYSIIKELYENHKEHALAFFQAFGDLGVINKEDKSLLKSFYKEFESLRSVTRTEDFLAILDPDFQEVIFSLKERTNPTNKDIFKFVSMFASFEIEKVSEAFLLSSKVKEDFKLKEDLFELIYTLVKNPKVMENFDSAEGKKLLGIFCQNNLSVSHNSKFFEHPNSVEVIERFDKFITIRDGHTYELSKLCEEGDLINGLLDFLEKGDFATNEKLECNEIPLLVEFYNIESLKNSSNVAYLGKHLDFYFKRSFLNFLQNNQDKSAELLSLAEDGYLDGAEKSGIDFFEENFEDILGIPREKRGLYMELYNRLDKLPSREIQRVKRELGRELLKLENPEEAYERVEEVFMTNNLPQVGKLYKVFSIIHNPERMSRTLKDYEHLSPYLVESSNRRRYSTIYKDLLNIHIKSGNRSLRDYLEVMQDGQKLFDKIEAEGEEGLDDEEKNKVKFILKKMKTLSDNSARGMNAESDELNLGEGLDSPYQKIKESIDAKEGQTIVNRISQMFLAPAGFEDIEGVLAKMEKERIEANERNVRTAELLQKGEFKVEEGDLLKGINARNMRLILQGGLVAGEFLGSDASTDATPYDSDFIKFPKESDKKDFLSNVEEYSANYGDIEVIVKNRDQFYETSKGYSRSYDSSKLEIFKSDQVSEHHYGVRTGVPSSEISLIKTTLRIIEEGDLFFDIAENGIYIPVTNNSGKLIFTPEQYQEYRRAFRGLERFDGDAFEYADTKQGDINFEEVEGLRQEFKKEKETINELSQKIRNLVEEVLEENGVKLREKYDNNILGAELLDIGSTARNTNAIGDYDFDLSLCLDDNDMDKIEDIVRILREKLQIEKDNGSHGDGWGGYQLRVKECKVFGENPLDIDIGFVRKNDLMYLSSSEAVQERLDWIKNNIGEEAHEKVVSNIILAKKILKEGNAYKKVEDGGIGGIGVENWILFNNGNMADAFKSFLVAAFDESGNKIPLAEFRKKYKILDPGMNLKGSGHDDFVNKLKEKGYDEMIKIIKDYLSKEKQF